ncbi:hypothetical protein JX265_006749 [Neoarthrinium moseri]|uniref:Uncharacterized protein n=1 Tax=Neoarthrinium moseri TaxID=1658444 RepID=A0A9P9WKU3_9PEZI|nr:hypothetical protein JX265_006749 [Neoarthrinium moseri]
MSGPLGGSKTPVPGRYTPLAQGVDTVDADVEMDSLPRNPILNGNLNADHYGHSFPFKAATSQRHLNQYAEAELSPFEKWAPFSALVPLISISVVLFIGDTRHWVAPDSTYSFIRSNRTVTQVAVQVIAYTLGMMNTFVVCRLVQYVIRSRLSTRSISLNSLRFWTAILSQKLLTSLPFYLSTSLAVFCALSAGPSAVWTGALTPIEVVSNHSTVMRVPQYSSTEMLLYNWGQRFGSHFRQSDQGLFTYNVGEQYMPYLMNSLATATTVDGAPRVHPKLDNTGFYFTGRSYGTGAPIGLVDDALSKTSHATGYSYIEHGYVPHVDCIYNSSADFSLQCQSNTYTVCTAIGYLPNSLLGEPEALEYMGYSSDPMVTIGITSNPSQPRRMLAMAAGRDYDHLDKVQCEWEFKPSQFSVSTDFAAKNISVTPLHQGSTSPSTDDFEPKGNLTFLANWQFNLMSSDLSSLYSSFLGKSINANIENYKFAHNANRTQSQLSDGEAILGGLEAALEAVMDDILLGYAGAQLMVANVSSDVEVHLLTRSVKFGQTSWIAAAFAFNILLLMWTSAEAVRTSGWKTLTKFDFTDPAQLVLGTARATRYTRDNDHLESYSVKDNQAGGVKYGKIRVSQHGQCLVISDCEF